jgi:hypothetical protein
MSRRERVIVWISLLFLALLGVLFIGVGISTAFQPEPTVPTCGGIAMQPGDECDHQTETLVVGIPTSQQEQVVSYDEQLADDRTTHDRWPIDLGVGVVLAALGLGGFLFLSRRR